MKTPPLRRALLSLPGASFRAKALALAGLAAAVPLALLAALAFAPQSFAGGAGPIAFLGVGLLASLAALFALGALLAAIGEAAAGAKANALLAGAEAPARAHADEVMGMMSDIQTVAQRLESVRHRLANRHPVTGVSTREPLLAAIAKDLQASPPPAALLGVVRLNQFDRLAAVDRPAAEAALRAFAQRLVELAGPGRPFAQVDRDCFAVWFCDPAGPRGAAKALKALVEQAAEPFGEGEARLAPDVRAGAAVFPNDGADGGALIAAAVAALAKAERTSAGRLAFFSDESTAEAEARFAMEQALRQAIARQELTLCYQPVIDLVAGRVVGAEALLRWRHPEAGPIPPARFLPVLERSGMIDEVGRWVLDQACRDARMFERLGLPAFRVGVNLSERQFRDPNLPALVADTLRRHELKPGRLELELTETALMEDVPRTRETFEALGALGVGLAIDDFGVGASSLGDLKSLAFTKLKIDRAFVTGVGDKQDSQAVCAALIELGRRLDIAVLAEGVETREEVEALRVLGCQLFQGFFFARPLPADKFVRKVADPDWQALIAEPAHRIPALAEPRLVG